MYRDACERGGAGGKGCGERLAFAGLHFRDLAFEHHASAQQLHVEGAQAQAATGDLADDGEYARHQRLLQSFAVKAPPELRDAFPELPVGQPAQRLRLEVHAGQKFLVAGLAPVGALSKEPAEVGCGAIEPAVAQILALRIASERDPRAKHSGARH